MTHGQLGVLLGVTAVLLVGRPTAAIGETEAVKPPSPEAEAAIALLDSDDAYQRQVGFLRLEALREPSTAATIRTYLTHSDPDMRAYTLRALAAIEGVRAVPDLIGALNTDRAERVRRAALLGLEPLQPGDPKILPALITALRDRKPEVRMTALDIVSRIDDPRARKAILTRNKRERDRNVQLALTAAMKRLGTDTE